MKKKRNFGFSKIRKYHINIFTTNILALVLAIFFVRSYKLRGILISPIFIITPLLLLYPCFSCSLCKELEGQWNDFIYQTTSKPAALEPYTALFLSQICYLACAQNLSAAP